MAFSRFAKGPRRGPKPGPMPPSRAAILDLVRSGGQTVKSVVEARGIPETTAHYHLRKLLADGLVTRRWLHPGDVGKMRLEYRATEDS